MAHIFLLGISLWKGVPPMGVNNVLMLMISFGMLIAFIMSDQNKK
jgi:hypothetical protein